MTYFPGQAGCWRCSPSERYIQQTVGDTQNFPLKVEFVWVGLFVRVHDRYILQQPFTTEGWEQKSI